MKKIILPLLLLVCLSAMMPIDNFIAVLSQKMEAYYQSHPQEQVQLIFNQEKYAPSDTAFFQTYLLNEDFIAAKGKRILTLGIFDADGKMAQKINFSVFDGLASNQIIISPETLPGVYLFAIYNPEIKDLTSSLLYSKEISVVGKNKLSVKRSKASPNLTIAFEGGNFVNGVENRIIIKSDWAGPGKIKNNKSEEVAQFVIGKDGVANTLITPQTGESYYVEINGASINQPLTIAKEDGCTLRVTQSGSDQSKNILISVPLKSALRKKELYLVVTNRKRIVYSAPVAFDNNAKFQATMPRKYLKNGLSQATVFDNDGAVLTKRIFFTNQPNAVAALEFITKTVHPRDKVDVEFSLRDKVGNPLQGDFTISVYQKDFFTDTDSLSFKKDVLLKNPMFPQTKKEFSTLNSNDLSDTNLLDDLLAMKSDGLIPWSDILNPNQKPGQRLTNNLKIKGRAIFKNSGRPVPDSTLLMGYLQNAMVGYEARTGKDGLFEMPFLYDFWDKDELFYMMEYKGKEMGEEYQIIPEAVEFKTEASIASTLSDYLDAYGDYVQKKKIVEQSYNFFSSTKEKTIAPLNLNKEFEEEAMGTDFTVNVQDYIAFPTMEDLIREVIPYLQHRKRGNETVVKLLLNQKNNSIVPKGEPLFLIDGVLTKNKEFFLSLKPVDVLTIKLINNLNKLSHLGVLGKNGVVLVETKKSVAASVLENSTALKVQGLSKPLNSQPVIVKGDFQRIPDLRSILYWNPLQRVDNYGKTKLTFYASDNIGSFGVLIKGITKQGEPFEAQSSFEVAFNKQP
ncbi:MAG: hypothetical protein ACKVOQ_20195 [Cyclobacteriaceae bacterium]